MAEFVGRRVKILLQNGTDYEGFVHSMDQSCGKLTLEKVIIPSTGKKFQGLKHFFGDDLVSVDVLEGKIKSKKEEKDDRLVPDKRESGPRMVFNKHSPTHLNRLPTYNSKNKLLKRISSKEDLKSDSEQTENSEPRSSDNDSSDPDSGMSDDLFVVINRVNRKFDKAMREIYTQKTIGVSLEGVCVGRAGTLCWLNVGTHNRVFLFDVLTMGKECFDEGLKDLLEDGNVLKVMHDCRLPSDLLHHQFGVNLRNIFDTEVADAFVYRMFRGHGNWPRYVQSLQASLLDHLDLPQEQIQMMKVRAAHRKEDQQVWMERPAGRPLLEAACKNVMHLLDLRLILVEKMMAQFVAGVDVYLAHTRDANSDEANKHQSSTHLLPTAFKDLDRITSRNYEHYWRHTVTTDTNGFNDNCQGLADPDVIDSRDSIWRMSSRDSPNTYRFKGTTYMSKLEDLRRKGAFGTNTDQPGAILEEKKSSEEEPVKKVKTPGPILHSRQSSSTDSQSETESSKVPENSPKTSSLPNNDNSQTTGMLIRSLASKSGDTSECDSLESFSIRPAGIVQHNKIDRRKKSKNTEIKSPSYYAGPPELRANPEESVCDSENESQFNVSSLQSSLRDVEVVSPRSKITSSSVNYNAERNEYRGQEISVSPTPTSVSPTASTVSPPKKLSPLQKLQNSLNASSSRIEKHRLICNAFKNLH
ncbi:piRNA biogenesis protein EXD1-like [Argopecten irradians]|uniref:piRNA biogenesis protein EXD1-like n=1 Tax=Argopecten irradians TaxID=31199 RepID=UPI003724710B